MLQLFDAYSHEVNSGSIFCKWPYTFFKFIFQLIFTKFQVYKTCKHFLDWYLQLYLTRRILEKYSKMKDT